MVGGAAPDLARPPAQSPWILVELAVASIGHRSVQQIVKLSAAANAGVDVVLQVDPEVCFTSPFDPRADERDGRAAALLRDRPGGQKTGPE